MQGATPDGRLPTGPDTDVQTVAPHPTATDQTNNNQPDRTVTNQNQGQRTRTVTPGHGWTGLGTILLVLHLFEIKWALVYPSTHQPLHATAEVRSVTK